MDPEGTYEEIEAALNAAFFDPARQVQSYQNPDDQRKPDVSELLETLDPAHITAIERELRRIVERARSAQGWRSLPAFPCRLTLRNWRDPGVALALSTAGYGFDREAAIRRIARVPGPVGLSLLLLRLNDWVPEVRAAARQKLHSLLNAEPGDSRLSFCVILGCIDLILDFRRFGRAGEKEAEIVAQLLNRRDVIHALKTDLRTSRQDRVARTFSLAVQTPLIDGDLSALAKSAAHARVRAKAMPISVNRAVAWRKGGGVEARSLDVQEERKCLLDHGLNDVSPVVQRTALQCAIQNDLISILRIDSLTELLLHRSISISDRARYCLKHLGVEFLPVLRRALEGDAQNISAIIALGRFGADSDSARVYSARNDFSGVDRIHCLEAALKLGVEQAAGELKAVCLETDNEIEARMASRAFHRAGRHFGFEELMSAADSGIDVFRRGLRPSVRVLSAIRLATVMSALINAGQDEAMAPLWRLLSVKRNQGYFSPSRRDLDALFAAIGGNTKLRNKMSAALGVDQAGD